jgi:hypothetical protein
MRKEGASFLFHYTLLPFFLPTTHIRPFHRSVNPIGVIFSGLAAVTKPGAALETMAASTAIISHFRAISAGKRMAPASLRGTHSYAAKRRHEEEATRRRLTESNIFLHDEIAHSPVIKPYSINALGAHRM